MTGKKFTNMGKTEFVTTHETEGESRQSFVVMKDGYANAHYMVSRFPINTKQFNKFCDGLRI